MAQDTPEQSYLYDFIYLDRPRIASYFAQLFEENGVLTNLKTTSQSSSQSSYKANAGVPSLVGGEAAGSDTEAQAIERHFDTAWTLPINVLGGLRDSGYIYDDLAVTPIGQFVLVKGKLQILDVRIMKDVWPSAFSVMTMDANPQTSAHKKQYQAQKRQWDSMSGMISKLPHTLQMKFMSNGLDAWSTLSPDHMTVNPEDFALKHGANVQGEWYMVGIVDALPNDHEEIAPGIEGGIDQGMLGMLAMIRSVFGRPAHAYGVTPIAIYRPLQNRI